MTRLTAFFLAVLWTTTLGLGAPFQARDADTTAITPVVSVESEGAPDTNFNFSSLDGGFKSPRSHRAVDLVAKDYVGAPSLNQKLNTHLWAGQGAESSG